MINDNDIKINNNNNNDKDNDNNNKINNNSNTNDENYIKMIMITIIVVIILLIIIRRCMSTEKLEVIEYDIETCNWFSSWLWTFFIGILWNEIGLGIKSSKRLIRTLCI